MQKRMKEVSKPKRPPVVAIIGLICGLLTAGLQIGAVATTEWMVLGSVTFGMWQYCSSGSCSGHPDTILTDLFQVTRGLSVLGVLASAMTCAVGFVIVCIKERVVAIAAGCIAIFAAVAIMAEFSILVADLGNDLSASYGYSFYLSVGACITAVLTGILFLVTARVLRRAQMKH